MSATAESEKFARYFAVPIRDELAPAPIFNVQGRAYQIQEYYLEDLKQLCDGEVSAVPLSIQVIETFQISKAKVEYNYEWPFEICSSLFLF